MLLEVKFKKNFSPTRINIKNDGKIHSYSAQRNQTQAFEFDILPVNQLPTGQDDEEKKNFSAFMRSLLSPGKPKLILRYLLSREATDEDRAANSDARYDRANQIHQTEEEREYNRNELINLVEREDELKNDDLFEWAVAYLRSSSERLRKLLAITHQEIRLTSTYLYYTIEENVATMLKDVPGEPVVRLIGTGNYADLRTETPLPTQERKSEKMRYKLMKKEKKFRKHESDVFAVAFSPDGKMIASAGDDHKILIWDPKSDEVYGEFDIDEEDTCTSLVFSPDGRHLASGTQNGAVAVLDLKAIDGGVVWEKDRPSLGAVLSVAYSPDGTKIVTGGEEQTVTVWDSANGEIELDTEGYHYAILSVAFSQNGDEILAGTTDKVILVWNLANGSLKKVIEVNRTPRAVAFSPDGLHAVLGHEDGTISEWGLLNESERRRWRVGPIPINAVAYSPDGSRIVSSGGLNQHPIIWDVATGERLQGLSGNSAPIYSIAFSPDNTRIAVGATDGTATVWGYQSPSL